MPNASIAYLKSIGFRVWAQYLSPKPASISRNGEREYHGEFEGTPLKDYFSSKPASISRNGEHEHCGEFEGTPLKNYFSPKPASISIRKADL
jgi:hypothetical protein